MANTVEQKAKERGAAIKKGAGLGAKVANNAMKGDDLLSEDDLKGIVLENLPPEVREAIQTAQKVEEALDKVFPKGDDDERDFSTAGGIRTAIDLLNQYGSEEVKKILEARQKALDLASKLGFPVPTIEELIDFDWDKLSEKLENLDPSSLLDVKTILNSLEGELMKFLPPGMDKSIAAIKQMLSEFGLPTSLGEAYDQIKNPKPRPDPPAAAAPMPPGVYVNKQHIAKLGKTYVAHGAVPLAGPCAKTVFAEFVPVWCATPAHVHACAFPLVAPPKPDGPAFSSGGSPNVKVELFPVCRELLDSLDIACTKSNLLCPKGMAISLWKKLQEEAAKEIEEHDTNKNGGSGGGDGSGANGNNEGDSTDNNKDGEEKDTKKGVTARITITATDGQYIKQGTTFTIRCDSWNHDTSDQEQPTPESISVREWAAPSADYWFTEAVGKAGNTREFSVYVPPDARKVTNTIKLTVIDTEGDQDTIAVPVTFGRGVSPPTAGFVVIDSKGEIAGYSGASEVLTLHTGEEYTLRSRSFDPDIGTNANDNPGIIGFKWYAPPNGAGVFGSINQTMQSSEGGRHGIVLEVEDYDGETGTASLQVQFLPEPISKIGKIDLPDYSSDRIIGRNIVGDRYTIHSVSYVEGYPALEHITDHLWILDYGEKGISEARGNPLTGHFQHHGTLKVTLVAASGARIATIRDSRDFAVNLPLTWDHFTDVVGDALCEVFVSSIKDCVIEGAKELLKSKIKPAVSVKILGEHGSKRAEELFRAAANRAKSDVASEIVPLIVKCGIHGPAKFVIRKALEKTYSEEEIDEKLDILDDVASIIDFFRKIFKTIPHISEHFKQIVLTDQLIDFAVAAALDELEQQLL